MKDGKNLILLLLATGLVATWIYHLYDKSKYNDHTKVVLIMDSLATSQAISDSLHRLYNETVSDLDSTKFTTDSLKGQLDVKLAEINRLKTEINGILQNRTITKDDMRKARALISTLQMKIADMKAENSDLESERTRLNDILAQLNGDVKGLQDNMQRIQKQNEELTETINKASTFIASDIQFVIAGIKNGKETETNQAKKASKFIVSFNLQNNIAKNNFNDVYLVITNPAGKVIQKDVWSSDFFTTKNEGSKQSTTKIRFEYSPGEVKKIQFALEPDIITPGNYTLQIYQNGVRIAEAVKGLN